jgi:hypothetical protein
VFCVLYNYLNSIAAYWICIGCEPRLLGLYEWSVVIVIRISPLLPSPIIPTPVITVPLFQPQLFQTKTPIHTPSKTSIHAPSKTAIPSPVASYTVHCPSGVINVDATLWRIATPSRIVGLIALKASFQIVIIVLSTSVKNSVGWLFFCKKEPNSLFDKVNLEPFWAYTTNSISSITNLNHQNHIRTILIRAKTWTGHSKANNITLMFWGKESTSFTYMEFLLLYITKIVSFAELYYKIINAKICAKPFKMSKRLTTRSEDYLKMVQSWLSKPI